MDGSRFDELARGLGASGTRRGLLAAAGAVVAAVATALPGSAARKKGKDKPGAEGPCGNGSPKANRCKKNKDCCTGFCDKKKGKKQGRCRCKRAGQACTADRNCCVRRGQQMVCIAGVCAVPAPPCDACASGCEFATIQEAIDAADTGGTVTLCAGVYTEDITIDKDLTLVGDGEDATILTGTGTDSVVTMSGSPTVEISDLTITGGNSSGVGGGITNGNADTTLQRVTISGNTAATRGGGIDNNQGSVALIDTTVTDNTAGTDGGGIFTQGPLSVGSGSSVTDNTADGTGGGIGTGETGTTTIEAGAIVQGNSPEDCGGPGTVVGTCPTV